MDLRQVSNELEKCLTEVQNLCHSKNITGFIYTFFYSQNLIIV